MPSGDAATALAAAGAAGAGSSLLSSLKNEPLVEMSPSGASGPESPSCEHDYYDDMATPATPVDDKNADPDWAQTPIRVKRLSRNTKTIIPKKVTGNTLYLSSN